MATILLERKTELTNRLRDFGVYIDGKKTGVISNGETKEFEIAPGEHTISCKIDWCSSPVVTFNSTNDAIKIFKVGGFKNSYWIMPLGGGIAGLVFAAKFLKIDYSYLFYLLLPFLLLLIYYLTIGRKKYLSLVEI